MFNSLISLTKLGKQTIVKFSHLNVILKMPICLFLCCLNSLRLIRIYINFELLRNFLFQIYYILVFLLNFIDQILLPCLQLWTVRAPNFNLNLLILLIKERFLCLPLYLQLCFLNPCFKIFVPRIKLLHYRLCNNEPFL